MRTGNKVFDNDVASGRRRAAGKLHCTGVQGEQGLSTLTTSMQTAEFVVFVVLFFKQIR